MNDLFRERTFIERLLDTGLPMRGTYFEPTTMMVAAMAVSAVAALGSGAMSYMQGNQQAAMARQQASYAQSMAMRNKSLADMAAQQAVAKGQYEASLTRAQAARTLGKQMALMGASGVDIGGSPLEVMGHTSMEYERDAGTILHNAYYDAWRYQTSGDTSLISGTSEAARYTDQAGFDESKGMYSLALSPLAAGSSILTSYGYSQMAAKMVPAATTPAP